MLWIRLRFFAVAALAVGIASGGASVYVIGSQELAGEERHRRRPASDGRAGLARAADAPAERQASSCAATGHAKGQGLATRSPG